MPLIERSSYTRPPQHQFNGHLQTILPAMFPRHDHLDYTRERLELSDGDFVDLDWLKRGNSSLVILLHGLEGNSQRHYMKAAANFFHARHWDVLAWNCRSCSGEMNRKLRMYNHGEIGDIGEVIDHIIRKFSYEKIVLLGYSMGGSIALKYFGVHADELPEQVAGAVAFSAPTDLKASAEVLDRPSNWLYRKIFIRRLVKKFKIKSQQFPGVIDLHNLKRVKVWKDFDNYFSAPISGYQNADEFYQQASAKNFMSGIRRPCLLVNAGNDPIIPASCSPVELCKQHQFIYLENPSQGGHVGFSQSGSYYSWMEKRAYSFIEEYLQKNYKTSLI